MECGWERERERDSWMKFDLKLEECRAKNNDNNYLARTKIGLFCGPIGGGAAMCGGKYVVGDTGGLG